MIGCIGLATLFLMVVLRAVSCMLEALAQYIISNSDSLVYQAGPKTICNQYTPSGLRRKLER